MINPSNELEDNTTTEAPAAEKERLGEDDAFLEIEALRAENKKLKEEISMILNVYGPTNEGIYEEELSFRTEGKKKPKNRFKRWRQKNKERDEQRRELERRYPQLRKQRKKDETAEASGQVLEVVIETTGAILEGIAKGG